MADVSESDDLRIWLGGKPPEFACLLAARAALRVVPVLGYALHAEEEERRDAVILPSFRALAAGNFACTCPRRRAEIRDTARSAGRRARAAIEDRARDAQLSVFEAKDAESEISEWFWRLDDDAQSLGIARHAVDAVAHAAQALVDAIDAEKGIAGSDSVYDATLEAAVAARQTVDGIHGYTQLSNELESEDQSKTNVAEHIAEFWRAVNLDADSLETDTTASGQPKDAVANLAESKLWLEGTSVWAGRQWADFKDKLPANEGWRVWVDWYEARLVGQATNVDLESEWLKISDDDWRKGPAHVNAIIAKLIAAQADPLFAAVSSGFEELHAVKRVSSVDLAMHKDRIRHALSHDPFHAVGATKDMLEAVMKTILHRRGCEDTDNLRFSQLTTRCLSDLGLRKTSLPVTEGERHLRRIASCAQKMIQTVNELRNRAGTGHGRVVGHEPVITRADAGLVASAGLVLAAWLLRHDVDA